MASEVKVDKLSQKGSSGIVITDDIKLSSGKAIKNAAGTALLGEDGALGSGVTGAGLYKSIAIICDQKAYNVDGGTFTSGAWRTRELNTEIVDADAIVSISSNQFTLAAGTYHINWSAPAYSTDETASLLYNVTDASVVQYSQSGAASKYAAAAVQHNSDGRSVVTIAGTKAFEIRHRCQTTHVTHGFGIGATNVGDTDIDTIYTIVTILKL